MAFIEPMHRNKPNITYLLTYFPEFVHVCKVMIFGRLLIEPVTSVLLKEISSCERLLREQAITYKKPYNLSPEF